MKFDCIIVGFGLSGGILSQMLIESGRSVLVIDKPNPHSSSQVAAGLVNPITGRRVVKSWMADELIPFAKKFYHSIEKSADKIFFHEMDALEFVHSVKEMNDWNSRLGDANMEKYFSAEIPDAEYKDKVYPYQQIYRITHSGWLNIPLLITHLKSIIGSEYFREEQFDQSSLRINSEKIIYKNSEASVIIFCEGVKTTGNELWNWLPFLPAKGEIIVIQCEELPQNYILLSGIFIIPLGDHLFRVGATYEWDFADEEQTEAAKVKLINKLNAFLKLPYTIVNHQSGIRPTVKDRRPLIGSHPLHENVFVFNGMGTKGVQLVPYFADQFVQHLENGTDLVAEINVQRWYPG